jgi:hypothetical protein
MHGLQNIEKPIAQKKESNTTAGNKASQLAEEQSRGMWSPVFLT